MKKTLCALALSLATLGGCERQTTEMKHKTMTIPTGCVELKSVSEGYADRYFTCSDKDKQTVVYRYGYWGNKWTKYTLVKKSFEAK